MDPRTKLFLTFVCTVIFMFTQNVSVLALEAGLVTFLVFAFGFTRAWFKVLRLLLPSALFIFIVVSFSFDPATALAGVLRLTAITTAFFIFLQTTLPEDLANALVQSGVPYAFAFILTASMQFVPVLSRKMQDVIDAQRARGIRLERDLASMRNYQALLLPLLIQSFTLADQLAEAMEARGFGTTRRTFLREYALRVYDYATIALASIAAFFAWQLR